MKKILVDENEFNCPTSWDELTWSSYINLIQLEEVKDKFIVPVIYTQRFVEILCSVDEGVLDEMDFDTLAELEPVITEGFNPELLKGSTASTDHFIINGITYSFYL